MGNTGGKILADVDTDYGQIEQLTRDCLEDTHVQAAVNFPTTLRRLSKAEYDLLYRHGWEVANYTLLSRCPDIFAHQKVTFGEFTH